MHYKTRAKPWFCKLKCVYIFLADPVYILCFCVCIKYRPVSMQHMNFRVLVYVKCWLTL